MDPENPVVKLCVEGMQAEGVDAGRHSARIFQHAWEMASNDFERCVAAHYVARHQQEPSDRIAWNEKALQHAEASGDPRVVAFLPSLALALAAAHENAGHVKTAYQLYLAAERYSRSLPHDGYGSFIRNGIANGLARVAEVSPGSDFTPGGNEDDTTRRENTNTRDSHRKRPS